MKGLIIYSSKTGNTKKMAEAIYKEIKKITDVELVDIKDYIAGTVPCGLSQSKDNSGDCPSWTVPIEKQKKSGLLTSKNNTSTNYDFILLGAWIDRGTIENKAMKLFKTIENKKIGLFATLGAMADSEHGRKVIKNLEELLKNKDSLGAYICPGLVDSKMIEKLKGITGMVVPKKIKEKMIETSLNSRYATEEELKKASGFFMNKIKNLKEECWKKLKTI